MTHKTKFLIEDPGLFWSLQTIEQIGKYTLSTQRVVESEDIYLDTKKRRLFKAGYTCRKRSQKKDIQITLTRLPSSQQSAKHWDLLLDKNSFYPSDWPKSQVRKRVMKVIPDKKVREIMVLYQTRITRVISKDNQEIAQAYLDDIKITPKGKTKKFKHLMIKTLIPKGQAHLKKIAEILQNEWSLEPETLTKFERALVVEKRNR